MQALAANAAYAVIRRSLLAYLNGCNVGVSVVSRSCVGGSLGDLHCLAGWRVQARTMRQCDVECTALLALSQRILRLPRRFLRTPFDPHVRLA